LKQFIVHNNNSKFAVSRTPIKQKNGNDKDEGEGTATTAK